MPAWEPDWPDWRGDAKFMLDRLTDAERLDVLRLYCHACGCKLDEHDQNSSWHGPGICGPCAPDPGD